MSLRNRIGNHLRLVHLGDRIIRYARAFPVWNRWCTSQEILVIPQGKRILVLAPHMDDEVIGCGGVIRKCALEGMEITVAYMTDGRWGHESMVGLVGKELQESQERLIQVRKNEALLSCDVLGVQHTRFLGLEDRKLRATKEVCGLVAELLVELRPDAVFCPWFLEEHPDHAETARILMRASERAGVDSFCYFYEVWTCLYPSCLADISGVMDVKRLALKCHASQLTGIDYLRAVEGLNAYRAMRIPGARFAEAFLAMPLKDALRYQGMVA